MCKPTTTTTPQKEKVKADNGNTASNKPVKSSVSAKVTAASNHDKHIRNTSYDPLFFLLPLVLAQVPSLLGKLLGNEFLQNLKTDVTPIYITGVARIVVMKMILTLHYIFVDKDNYLNKLPHRQLLRERSDYCVAPLMHMATQVILQFVFPQMFFSDDIHIKQLAKLTLVSHVLLVEPLYYAVHRWLHIPHVMKAMHGFHHLSIKTTPATASVQNFHEHFVYIATFGPAFFVPFLMTGMQHWKVIGTYLVLFDAINAFGHTNIRIRNKLWTHKYSPFKYLFYTPELHLGHHAYFQANYMLFMPFWDYVLGTAREYKKSDAPLKPANQQDFVFIGHNAGLGHLMTCPEFSIYNVYDNFKFLMPMKLEVLFMHAFGLFARLFIKFYYCSRYLINNQYIGRIVCIVRTPYDFIVPKKYPGINKDIVNLIKKQYQTCGTRYFGLGNWTKMKQVNDGGRVIAEMVQSDDYLRDKNIRIWTGDTLTSASVFYQIMEIAHDINEIFFIGANGKIGVAVIDLLLKKRPNFKIKVFSKHEGIQHPNVSYTSDLSEMLNYKVAVVGKMLPNSKYVKAFKKGVECKTRVMLDYCVPFIPISVKAHPHIQHIQIGLLESTNPEFLKGPFDVCMSHAQNHIYPCHACCIINTVEKRETNEIGDIVVEDMEIYWNKALKYGLRNRNISSLIKDCDNA